MGERIEWEAIARRKHQIARVTRGGLASTAEERELEYIDALEAGEALYGAGDLLAQELCEDEPGMVGIIKRFNEALDAWRRCVAPRGGLNMSRRKD